MNTIDQELINVRADEKLDLNKLKTYLKNELDYSFDNIEIFQFSGGHANLTYLLQLDNKEYVLRRPPLGPIAPSSHDMLREYKVLSLIHI